MRRFALGPLERIPLSVFAGLVLYTLLLSRASAQHSEGGDSATEPGLSHLSIWTSPAPAPDNAFGALLMTAVRLAAYCEPVSLQPQFGNDITRYEAEFPGDVDLNVLVAATVPDALIEMSLTSAAGDALPVVTADGVNVEMNGVSIGIPRVWSLPRQIARGRLSVSGMPVGENSLEILVSGAAGDASRSYVLQLNRLAPDTTAIGEPECAEPKLDALLDAVAELEPAVAQ